MNIKTPLVSVYVVNYNYAQYVDEAILSVLNQSYKNLEVIVIDDGSTDNSREIISNYKEHDKVSVIFQKNRGLNATNNIAIKEANGEYIVRLDADDYFQRDALLVLVNRLEQDPDLAMVFPDYYYIDSQGNILGNEIRYDFSREVTLKNLPAHGACTMFRRSVLLDVGMYTEGLRCQDGYDIWLKIINKYKVDNIRLPLFFYRKHPDSLSSPKEKILMARSNIINLHAKNSTLPELRTAAILPIRGKQIDPSCIALEPLGKKRVIDWVLQSSLKSNCIERVVVSTPDMDIIDYLTEHYLGQVDIHHRDYSLASISETNLKLTLLNVMHHFNITHKFGAIMQLSISAPFMSDIYYDKALNTMRLMDVDFVIGAHVVDENHYNHDGTGLKVMGNNKYLGGLIIEKKHLYKQIPGVLLIRGSHLNSDENILSGQVAHIEIDEKSALTIRTDFDLNVAIALVEHGYFSE
jgi:glycosyltransferase involved in cell wall biosynthesis